VTVHDDVSPVTTYPHDGDLDSVRLAERLARLGLPSYEARAYLALTRRDTSTAAQVARLSSVPRQRIYDVLASLVEKGLASARPGKVVKYAATAPEQAMDALVSRQRRQLALAEEDASALIEELTPAFEAGREQTNPLEYIEVLRDRRAINERFAELQAGVKHEILVFTKPPYETPVQENVDGLDVVRKHDTYNVYELSALDDPRFVEGIRRRPEAGEQARFVPELPLKLVIIDEHTVMFGLEDPVAGSSELTMLVVEHAALAGLLKLAFTAVWNKGLSLEEAQDRLTRQGSNPADTPP
jgi:HTH-type transcriptional regulator, sugar sensing transcriptional regulator